jgi:NAD(P)-dependent dehydrogenase (short-subunit alcohol dehydrogenase family)
MADVVVITGGTAGVGRAVARRFARQGAKLAILARRPDELRSTAVEVVTLGASAALGIPCDTDDEAQLASATQRIEQELGPIDVWIDFSTPAPRSRKRFVVAAAAAFVGALAVGLVLRRVLR